MNWNKIINKLRTPNPPEPAVATRRFPADFQAIENSSKAMLVQMESLGAIITGRLCSDGFMLIAWLGDPSKPSWHRIVLDEDLERAVRTLNYSLMAHISMAELPPCHQ
jgi:hypothetical protein